MPRSWPLVVLLAACTPTVKPEAVPDAPAAPTVVPPAEPAVPSAPPADPLGQFLKDRGLVYEAPSGYRVAEAPASDRWAHVHAIASTTLDVEIRFGAAPAAVDERLRATCNGDARCAAAPTKAALSAILGAAVEKLAAPGSEPRIKEFPLDAVRNEFNAHWGGAIGFDVDPGFSARKQGLAIVIHREGRGTAMFVTLYPEFSDANEDERMRAFHALKFADPFVAAEAAHAGLAGTFWNCGDELSYLRFEPSTFTLMVLSAAMLAMGNRIPFETEYAEVTYLPAGRLAAVPFRIDNMERGDRTPKTATTVNYSYERKDDRLTFKADTWKEPWVCTQVER